MCCFELHFHWTVFWVVTALWPEVLLSLEHSYSMTAARSSVSPTLEKGKIITDFFLTLPKLAWTRDAVGSCWPLLSKCRIRLVTRKKPATILRYSTHLYNKEGSVTSQHSQDNYAAWPSTITDHTALWTIRRVMFWSSWCTSGIRTPKKNKQWTSEMKPLRVSLCGTFEIAVHAKILEEFCRNRFLQISVAKKGHHNKLIWHQITSNSVMRTKHFARF